MIPELFHLYSHLDDVLSDCQKISFLSPSLNTSYIFLQPMNQDQLTVEVVDRRLQVDLDEQEGVKSGSNEFMQSQGFQSKDKEARQEQEEQQQPHYKLQKLLPKQNQKQRLIEQNIKLKTQIYELAKQLDEILQKDKSKKKNYGIGLNRIEEEDQLIREKRLEVQKQQIQIADLKNRIFIAKRQLQCVYNNDTILLKEDEIKNLKGELKTLEDEKQGHLNIQKLQNKALKVVRNEEEYGEKMKNVVGQCARLRKESKNLLQEIISSERVLMRTHDTYVTKHETLRDIEQKLAINKQKAKNKKQNDNLISQEMISSMEAEVKQLQLQRKEGQKNWQQKIKAVDIELMLKRNEEEKKLMILKEKQRELKINELKIRQLRKLVRQNDDGGNQARRTSKDMDMSQFRHKRNIRYLQK